MITRILLAILLTCAISLQSRAEHPETYGSKVLATGKLLGIPEYPRPKAMHTTVFDQFPDFQLPEGIINVAGWGFPTYADMPTNSKGKLIIFDKGFTHMTNLSGYDRSKFADYENGQ
jgi:hypothetical protein